jgi:hypothetical protein
MNPLINSTDITTAFTDALRAYNQTDWKLRPAEKTFRLGYNDLDCGLLKFDADGPEFQAQFCLTIRDDEGDLRILTLLRVRYNIGFVVIHIDGETDTSRIDDLFSFSKELRANGFIVISLFNMLVETKKELNRRWDRGDFSNLLNHKKV